MINYYNMLSKYEEGIKIIDKRYTLCYTFNTFLQEP